MNELRSLFEKWQKDPAARFARGLAPLKKAFKHLLAIRPWSVIDRLSETGLLEDWKARTEFDQENVFFEAELWYRRSEERHQAAGNQLRLLVEELNGEIVMRNRQHCLGQGMLPQTDENRVRGLVELVRMFAGSS